MCYPGYHFNSYAGVYEPDDEPELSDMFDRWDETGERLTVSEDEFDAMYDIAETIEAANRVILKFLDVFDDIRDELVSAQECAQLVLDSALECRLAIADVPRLISSANKLSIDASRSNVSYDDSEMIGSIVKGLSDDEFMRRLIAFGDNAYELDPDRVAASTLDRCYEQDLDLANIYDFEQVCNMLSTPAADALCWVDMIDHLCDVLPSYATKE